MSVRVLHCDDSEAYRRLVFEMLADEPGIEHAGDAADAADAVRAAVATRPDVILLDLRFDPQAGDVPALLRAAAPGAALVVLSGLPDDGSVAADGYVSKSAPFDELVAAIRGARRMDDSP